MNQRHRWPESVWCGRIAGPPVDRNSVARIATLFLCSLCFSVVSSTAVGQSDDTIAGAAVSVNANIIRLDPIPGFRERPVLTALAVSSDGTLLAAAGDDHAIRLVSIADRKTTQTWTGHIDWVRGLAISPNGQTIASCGNDGWLRVWKAGVEAPVAQWEAPNALYAVVYLNDDEIFAVGFGPEVFRASILSNRLIVDHASDCRDLRTIAISPQRDKIAYAGRDGVLHVRSIEATTTTSIANVPVHFDRIRSVTFSEDGNFITSVGEDRRITHFDIGAKAVVGQSEIRGGKLMGMFPWNEDLIAVAGADNTIRIVDWGTLKPQVRLIGHDGTVVVLQRANRYLVSASFDTTIRLWDIEKAIREQDGEGRFVHPVSAQFEDSGTTENSNYINAVIRK